MSDTSLDCQGVHPGCLCANDASRFLSGGQQRLPVPDLLAAVSFDQTGTTRIGKSPLNHSFLLPGLVTVVAALAIAALLGSILVKSDSYLAERKFFDLSDLGFG